MKRALVLVLCTSSLAACSGGAGSKDLGTDGGAQDMGSALGPDEIPLAVAQTCPGDPGCPDEGDGQLYVGFAMREITPQIEPFDDANGNGRRDLDESYTDLNDNGKFDGYTLFNTGKQVLGVHDPIWARCYVLRQNQTTLAHCALDVGGYMYNEVKQIRADLDPKLGVDLVLTSATHDHSAPDTVGIFGIEDTVSGYVPEWMAEIRGKVVEAITEAVGGLRPAKMSIASIPVEEAGHDMTHLIDDTRDPVVIDNVMHLMQFDDAESGEPIVTVLNWTAHPDSQSHSNQLVSSEFPYYLREALEQHAGSPVVYVSGAVGGQIGAGRVRVTTDDGTELPCGERSYRFIEAWAKNMAAFAERAFDERQPVASPRLSFRTAQVNLHVDNTMYHTAFALQLIPRTLFGYDPTKPMIRDEHGDNAPLIDSELAYVRLGPAAIATMPGELLPELFLGGYDGSKAGTWTPFIHTGPIVEWCDPQTETGDGDYPAPPDVSMAPKPPYLIDEMGGEREHRMIFGLTQDMLGYIIPVYNFYLDPVAPYLQEPPGDSHYEETNSLGPRAAPEMVGTMRQLVESIERP